MNRRNIYDAEPGASCVADYPFGLCAVDLDHLCFLSIMVNGRVRLPDLF